MLTLRVVRGVCAALDTIALTAIAAAFTKKSLRSRPDSAAFLTVPSNLTPHKAPFPDPSEPERQPHDLPDAERLSDPALIKLKNERDPERLFRLFRDNAHNRVVVENRFAFEDVVSRLAGARRFDLVEELLEHQKGLPQGLREGFVIRVIMLYGKARMPDHALKTFRTMDLYGCPRTVKSFNATLRVLNMYNRFEDVQVLLGEVRDKYGISLDQISYNLVVSAMCRRGSLEHAYLAMIEMEKVGTKPDVVTYTTLISAFYKYNRREVGDGLWNLMLLRGCLPNLATFNARIQYLINKHRVWQASSLMKKMGHVGVKPDELTYNLVIKGFCLVGDIGMAKSVFFSMQGKECKPNCKIYQTIVHYLCKYRDFNLAFKLCRDGMKKNWFPNTDTISQLLEGLVTISKDKNIKELMKLVKRRVPPYSAEEIEIFQLKLDPLKKINDT